MFNKLFSLLVDRGDGSGSYSTVRNWVTPRELWHCRNSKEGKFLVYVLICGTPPSAFWGSFHIPSYPS